MIFFIMAFALLALIASLGWMHTEKKLKAKLLKCECDLSQAQLQVSAKDIKIQSLNSKIKSLLASSDQPQESDALVPDKAIRNRYPRKPTPMDYYQLFEAHPIGRDVMDDLVNIFGGATYVRGGHDADRETCFKAGKKFVVDHILIQISKATETKQDKSEVTIDDN